MATGVVVSAGLLHGPVSNGVTVARCDTPVRVEGTLLCNREELATECPDGSVSLRAGDAVGGCGENPGRLPPGDLAALGVVIDVNGDRAEDLTSLPGVGPVIAGRMVAGRPYRSVDELRRVKGVGPVRLARMRSRVRVR